VSETLGGGEHQVGRTGRKRRWMEGDDLGGQSSGSKKKRRKEE